MKKKPISEPLLAAIGIAGLASNEGLVRTFSSLAGERTIRRALEYLSGRGCDRRKDGDGAWERLAPGVRCLLCGRKNVVALWRRLPGLEQVTVKFGHGLVGWPVSDMRICEVKLSLHAYAQLRADWEAKRLLPAEPTVERRLVELWGNPTVHWALAAERAQDFAAHLDRSIGPAREMAQSGTAVDWYARSLIGSVMLEAIRLAGVAGQPHDLPLKRTVAERSLTWSPGSESAMAQVPWEPPRATFLAPGRRIWVTTPYELAQTTVLDSCTWKALERAQARWDWFTAPKPNRNGRSPYQDLVEGGGVPRMLLVARREDLKGVREVLGTMPSVDGRHPELKTRIVAPGVAAAYLLTAVGRKVEAGNFENF